ncbi:sulfotransferase [Gimibacter soli]|uniref:Sulfotransferase family protein n=1 Tax=Gimibacter soli TaxID=3024400 RepID=A0AAE9XQH5_9PROT|nr:sulfotransferase [Gimibacter soli]WCL53050.1 hypothetical protein PH603_10915 [Gimibacter soli]
MNKIFGIGCSRTGTKSLSLSMQNFGFRVQHYPDAAAMLRRDFSILDDVDFANDIPVSINYRNLDKHYPGSKFILTTRDKSTWLQSCGNMFFREKMIEKYKDTPQDEVFRKMYGGFSYFDEKAFSESYDAHCNDVISYFSDRSGDFLVLPVELESQQKLELLSRFTGRRAQAEFYPHAHRTS